MVSPGKTFVLGAGASGLSAAYHLGGDVEVFESSPYPFGHCRTKNVDGFLFDEGPHVFFGTDEVSQKLVREPLAGELEHHRAEMWNDYGDARFGRYPVQANLHALPTDIREACLLDFIAAAHAPETAPENYDAWCRASFGNAMAEKFMFRYARKLWTVEPSELGTDWLGSSVGGRILRPSLAQVVRGALEEANQDLSYYTDFCYPREGGFERVLSPLRAGVHALRLGCGAVRIETGTRRLELADGSSRDFGKLISSIPLPTLVSLIVDAPREIQEAADQLLWTSLRCVSFGVARPGLGRGHWNYFYDERVPFFRASFPYKYAAGNAPSGCSSVTCEVAYSKRLPLDEKGLVERCRVSLVGEGILEPSDRILVTDVMDVPFAYVVFDAHRKRALETIHGWLEGQGILACGRFGEWGYHWSFDAIESGRRASQERTAVIGNAL